MSNLEITNECYVHSNDIRDLADAKGSSLELAHRHVLAAFNARGIRTRSDALFHEPEHLHCLCVVDGAVTWRPENSDDCKRKISVDDLMARPVTIVDELLDALVAVKSTDHFQKMSKPLQEQVTAAIAKAEGRS